jgi:CubicO group peptidase (beta-lactamase class C family)
VINFLLWLGCTATKNQDTASEPLWSDISTQLETIQTEHSVPALGAARIKGGEISDLGTVGLRRSDYVAEVTDSDKWHLGSCTKAMTATLVGTYVDTGEISWESTVTELFPSVNIHEDYKDVTVEMLLSHRGGTWSSLTTHTSTWAMMSEDGDVVAQRAQAVEDILTTAPEVTPGTELLYSNAGFIIVGSALEELTGSSWETMMQSRLFDPLGMDSCGFGVTDPDGLVDHPWGHTATEPVLRDNPASLGPAGTVHCNLADWGDFIIDQIKGHQGTGTFISAAQYQQLFEIQGDDYGMGWIVVNIPDLGGEVFSHSGSNTWNRSDVWAAPEIDEAYLVVTNLATESASAALEDALNLLRDME